MTMHVHVECRPNTLGEAEVAQEVLRAVESVLAAYNGGLGPAAHVHVVRAYPDARPPLPWYDTGLRIEAEGTASVLGHRSRS